MAPADPSRVLLLRAPAIAGFQPARSWAVGDVIAVQKKGAGNNEGWLTELLYGQRVADSAPPGASGATVRLSSFAGKWESESE